MATQLGPDMTLGATTTLTLPNAANYIVESCTEGGKQLDREDVFDASGALVTIILFNALPKFELTLLCKSSAAPTTDFTEGTLINCGSGVTFYVESAPVVKTKSPHRVTVSLTNVGFVA